MNPFFMVAGTRIDVMKGKGPWNVLNNGFPDTIFKFIHVIICDNGLKILHLIAVVKFFAES